MKLLLILIWLLFSPLEDQKLIFLNDILYKMPEGELTLIKTTYNIQEKDITIFKFNKDSCGVSSVEWIKIPTLNESNDPYNKYRAKTNPLFICDGKFVDTEYIYQDDIQSIEHMRIDKAISIYNCKGLNPIFIIKLRFGKFIQSKPVGAGAPKFSHSYSNSLPQVKDQFTIIGKTKGFRDSSILYLKKAESGSLRDNLDSTFVINNSFIFKGTISEPCPYFIHTGYTGWTGQPPESFHSISFFVNSSTIYLNDEIGNLKYARISGSELQNDENKLKEMYNPIISAFDSINKAIMKLSPTDSIKRKILRKEFQQKYEAAQQISIDFIKTHPKSIISAYDLNVYKSLWGREKARDLFNILEPQIQNTTYGKSVKEYINLKYAIDIGDYFVDIELKNLNGDLVKLSSLRGKYILLEFWSSYCGPCRTENVALLKLYDQYKKKGFEIYGVNLDEKKESWQLAVKDDKISWITVSDLKGSTRSEAAMIYEVSGIPKNYLIDKEGKIIAQDIRGEVLSRKLSEIFSAK
jgi:peroxiredoxin